MDLCKAYKLFCQKTSIKPNEISFDSLLLEEADFEQARIKKENPKSRPRFEDCIAIATHRFISWTEFGSECKKCSLQEAFELIQSHRRGYAWCTLLGFLSAYKGE